MVGFESIYFMHNLGTLLLAYLGYPATVLVQRIAFAFRRRSKKWRKLSQKLYRDLYYGSLIRLIFESYSLISVCALINMKFLSADSFGQTIMSMVAVFFFAVVIGFPWTFYIILKKNFNILHEKNFEQKYGAFYEDLDLRDPSVLS